ncbi:hypothetical protein [Spiroplasma endosymbiont of Glossina fuscipes fuscipes]|uniref:hypothetical protein n=1 Tax=Spiroplasma endosymbiont of Glossina fuscipes fuscipes TaxID=2004463 RepID=UPI003C7778C4
MLFFWFIFYFGWIEPKNTNYSKTDQIIVTNKKPLNQDFKNKNYYWDIADKLNAFCIYTIYYFKRNIDKIEEQLIQRANTMTNFDTSKQEQKSWKFNLLIIQNLLLDSKLPDDVLIVFEWIQKNQTRIDITLLAVDKNNKRNIITIEIKNWSARSTGWNIYWEKNQARNRNPHPYHKAEKQYLAIRIK